MHHDVIAQVEERADRLPVDGGNFVAGLYARGHCRPVFFHCSNARRDHDVAIGVGKSAEDQHCHGEVGEWPCRNDQRALPQGLRLERLGTLLLRQGKPFLVLDRAARRVHVARKLDVAAQRQGSDFPAGAALVGPADQFLPEADREGIGLHAEPAPDQIMPKLVHRDERTQHGQKADDPHPPGYRISHFRRSPAYRKPSRALRHRSPAHRQAMRAQAEHSGKAVARPLTQCG